MQTIFINQTYLIYLGRKLWPSVLICTLLFIFISGCTIEQGSQIDSPTVQSDTPDFSTVPDYEVDASWPGELPDKWILGQVAGIAVDQNDHVWIVHRPRTLTAHEAGAVQNPPTAECCIPAPSVIEFDADGNFVQAWGGPNWDQQTATWIEPPYDWPQNEHGIFIDAEDNVWLGGNGANDHIVLKMTKDGEHQMTIGRMNETGGSNDIERLGKPADIFVDIDARETYIADGYGNRRVIVFDMDTGEYKRHWGAYGNVPDDGELPAYDPDAPPRQNFSSPVHALELTSDGLLYVSDRSSNRIQIFEKDGSFVSETIIAPWTLDQGSVWDIERAHFADEKWLFVTDGHNKKVWIIERDGMHIVAEFGRGGRQAGQFEWVHNITADSKGNIYTSEVNTGKRVQKFRPISP
jgi:hypothetical protein